MIKKIILLIVLLLALIYAGLRTYEKTPSVAARRVLSYARLAPLPESCSDLKVYRWSTPISGEDYISFKASKEDIEKFIANSPALQDKEPEVYSAERMRIRIPEDYGTKEEHFNTPYDEYWRPRPATPEWYDGELKGNGRIYEVQPERYQFPGELIINDETNVIYIMLVFS